MNLLFLNLFACILHLANALLFLFYGINFSIPLSIQYAKWINNNMEYKCFQIMEDGTENTCLIKYSTDEMESLKINVKYLIASFSLVSSFFHLVNVIFYRIYIRNILNEKRNPLRWLEYTISAPIMIVCIAILNGISNIQTLILLFVLMSTVMVFGWLQEKESRGTNLVTIDSPTLIGWFPYSTVWIVIYLSFSYSVIETDVDTPTFVYIIIYSMFIMFSSFGVVQFLYVTKSSTIGSYKQSEKLYLILSFTSKTLLSWIIFFGMNNNKK